MTKATGRRVQSEATRAVGKPGGLAGVICPVLAGVSGPEVEDDIVLNLIDASVLVREVVGKRLG